MRIRIVQKQEEAQDTRVHIPAWLGDPERPAPCYCQRPVEPGEPYFIAEGEHNLKRIFHADCWMEMMGEATEFEDGQW